MARVTVEDCLQQVDSRFSLVHLAVRRVLQLRSGAPLLLEAPKNKEIVMALREIAAAKVTPDNVRHLEEQRALPETKLPQQEDVMLREVKEIVEAATHYDASLEFEEKAQFSESEEEE